MKMHNWSPIHTGLVKTILAHKNDRAK